MKSICGSLLGIALLLALTATKAQAYDDIDDLLADTNVSSSIELITSGEAVSTADDADSDVTYLHSAAWEHDAHVAPHSSAHAITPLAATVSDEEDTALSVNIVPEPSAMALAGLATVYFLIFCRRRQYV